MMIENKIEYRECLKPIGTITIFCIKYGWIEYILYDIFENEEEFVEIWIPYLKSINYNII